MPSIGVPEGVSWEAAALAELGIIARLGVRRAGLVPRQAVCVVGAGVVGALALRTAAAAGADPVAVIARSDHKRHAADAGGARRFLVTERDDDAIAELGAPVVIESTGDPAGLAVAVRAAGDGGRIVLLGSPRGTTPDVPVDAMKARRLEIVGAHVAVLGAGAARREEGEAFLAALASGEIPVSDLTGPAVDPREAGMFYRRLATANDVVGAHFDWARLPERERISTAISSIRPTWPCVVSSPNAARSGSRDRGVAGRSGSTTPSPGRPGACESGCSVAATSPCTTALLSHRHRTSSWRAATTRSRSSLTTSPGASVVTWPPAPTSSSHTTAWRPSSSPCPIICTPRWPSRPSTPGGTSSWRSRSPSRSRRRHSVVQAAEDAGVVLSVCFPQRFEPETVLAKRLIDDGALGPFCGSAARLFLDKTPAYWHGGFSGRSRSDWRGSARRAGGGVLIMNLSHHIDLVRHLVGAEIETVTAVAGVTDEQREVEDSISIGVTFAGGAVGSFTGWAAVRGTDSAELRVWGRDGHVVLEPEARIYTLRAIDGLRTGRWQALSRRGGAIGRAVYLSRLATAIDQGRPVDVPARDGLAVQAVIEAGYRSAAKGEVVRPSALLAETGP